MQILCESDAKSKEKKVEKAQANYASEAWKNANKCMKKHLFRPKTME